MASEDIQIVSVAKIECICLNRRPGSRGEAINLTDGSVDFDPGLGATILETSSRRKHSTKSNVEDDSAIDSVERLTRSPEVAFISSVPAKSRSSRLKAGRADESVKITCVSQPPRKKSRKVCTHMHTELSCWFTYTNTFYFYNLLHVHTFRVKGRNRMMLRSWQQQRSNYKAM